MPQAISELKMSREYSDCFQCGGHVEERRASREIWWHGRLHIVQDVPMGVCRQCGERYLHPSTARAIDRILAGEVAPDELVEVPTYRYQESESAA